MFAVTYGIRNWSPRVKHFDSLDDAQSFANRQAARWDVVSIRNLKTLETETF